MKKIFVVFALVCLVFACSRKTVPTEEIIISNRKTEKHTIGTAASGKLEAETGKTVYTTRCGRCHNLKPVEKYTAEQWDKILISMIPKARLSEKESNDVTAYVLANAKK